MVANGPSQKAHQEVYDCNIVGLLQVEKAQKKQTRKNIKKKNIYIHTLFFENCHFRLFFGLFLNPGAERLLEHPFQTFFEFSRERPR